MKNNTQELYFTTDGFVNGELVYEKGQTYSVPVAGGSADRWIKRGAVPKSQLAKIPVGPEEIQENLDEGDNKENQDKTKDVPVKNNGGKNQGKNK